MRGATFCSGIGAPEAAAPWIDWRLSSEIEGFPRAVLEQRHGHRDARSPRNGSPAMWGDFTALRARHFARLNIPVPDIVVAGTPCFTAGHLVLTSHGYRPIEDIKTGDLVMTHLGRLRPVVRIGTKRAEVGVLRAVGLREPLTVTRDHPFLSVGWRAQNTRRNGEYARVEQWGEPEWVEAENMPGRQWCALTEYQRTAANVRSVKFGEREAMYVAGMYLGDGHIRRWRGRGKKALVLSLNEAKLAKLVAVIGAEGYIVGRERTSTRVTICDTALCDWIVGQFGELSHLKRLPAWVLGHPHRDMLLRGYLDTDGCIRGNGFSISTTSRALAYGAADLLNAENHVASVAFVETPRTTVIEGRTVRQRDWYQVTAFNREGSRKSRSRYGYLLRTVQSFHETDVASVFNIEVEGDNSYVLNGAVVHNCQSFSLAGLRGGLADPRGNLTMAFVRTIDAIDNLRRHRGQPGLLGVWENVPGVLSHGDNPFGCFLAALVGCDAPLVPPGRGKWTDAGVVAGPRRTVAWRLLDAQYFGLAQRRERVFVVFGPVGWPCADALFPVGEGVRRHPPTRGSSGEAVARPIAAGSARGSGYRNDADTADNLIAGSPQTYSIMPMNSGRDYKARPVDVAQPLMAGGPVGGNQGGDYVVQPTAYGGNNQAGPIDVATARNAHGGPHGRLDFESETFVVAPQPFESSKTHGIISRTSDEGNYGEAKETRPGKILRDLRSSVGAEAFSEWGLGVIASFPQAEVLFAGLLRRVNYEGKIRGELEFGAHDGSIEGSEGRMREMREVGRSRRSPHQWRPSGQSARELDAYLSGLPQQGAPPASLLHDLWRPSEGLWVLREALSTLQGARRSHGGEDPTKKDMHDLRRPGAQQKPVRQALHAGKESQDAPGLTADRGDPAHGKGGFGVSAVRRLTPRLPRMRATSGTAGRLHEHHLSRQTGCGWTTLPSHREQHGSTRAGLAAGASAGGRRDPPAPHRRMTTASREGETA